MHDVNRIRLSKNDVVHKDTKIMSKKTKELKALRKKIINQNTDLMSYASTIIANKEADKQQKIVARIAEKEEKTLIYVAFSQHVHKLLNDQKIRRSIQQQATFNEAFYKQYYRNRKGFGFSYSDVDKMVQKMKDIPLVPKKNQHNWKKTLVNILQATTYSRWMLGHPVINLHVENKDYTFLLTQLQVEPVSVNKSFYDSLAKYMKDNMELLGIDDVNKRIDFFCKQSEDDDHKQLSDLFRIEMSYGMSQLGRLKVVNNYWKQLAEEKGIAWYE